MGLITSGISTAVKHGSVAAQMPQGIGVPNFFLLILCVLGGIAITAATNQPVYVAAGALLGVYLLFAIRVADQWEKAAIFRLGRYRGLRGPGIFFIMPVIDTVSRMVDQRVRVSDVSAEAALTRDTVPVNVDAILFWVVWNAEKCIWKSKISVTPYSAVRRRHCANRSGATSSPK
jgi:hypothetical protein